MSNRLAHGHRKEIRRAAPFRRKKSKCAEKVRARASSDWQTSASASVILNPLINILPRDRTLRSRILVALLNEFSYSAKEILA